MVVRIASALAALFVCTQVGAAELEQTTGIELNEYCSDHSASAKSVACSMYIRGFGAGIEAGDGSKEKDKRIWCFPHNLTVAQARLVIEKYMRDNPGLLNLSAGMIVSIALNSAFPCDDEMAGRVAEELRRRFLAPRN